MADGKMTAARAVKSPESGTADDGCSSTIIRAVRKWLANFEGFSGSKLNVDFLPPEAGEFSIDVIPVNSVIKRYLDGSSVRQFDFVIAMRAFWGEDVRCQMDNIGFFEWLGDWLERKSRAGDLPELGEGRSCRRVEVNSSGYVFAPETEYARYQMQCRLVYRQAAAAPKPVAGHND